MSTVRDFMSEDVFVVSPETNLSEVANQMKNKDTGFIPICDGNRLKGTVTDRDIVIRAIAENRNPNETRVSDIMTPEVNYVFDDQSIEDATEIMQSKQIRRLMVLNRSKNLCGVLSLGDISSSKNQHSGSGETLDAISNKGRQKSSESLTQNPNSFWQAFGILSFGSSIAALAYYVFKQTPEIRDQIKKVVPLAKYQDRSILRTS